VSIIALPPFGNFICELCAFSDHHHWQSLGKIAEAAKTGTESN
jgi:hypothetical protein